MNYTPLWIKTDYSILTSLIKIDDLINLLSLNNIKCASICDSNLFGVMELYDKCINKGIKPIVGLEVNLDFTVLLYAKNYEGYQNLCNISTLVSSNKLDMDSLFKYLSNLIIILPFEYSKYKSYFEKYSNDLYIGYKNIDEKNAINDKKVFINKTLCFDKNDEKYLKYLYKIKEEDYKIGQEVSLKYDIDQEDKESIDRICDLCNLRIPKNTDLLPVYSSDKEFDEKKYLSDLCVAGLKKRLNGIVTKKYVERLNYELDVIIKMGFCNYFLVVWDYVKYAKKNDIMVGPGRGSSASSLVSYCLGITDIDPLKYDLLFERFLNPQRVTMPDIDIDFDAEKRDDVIKYVTQKYGNEKVCGIITFSNLLAKQVIRDIARQFDISNFKIDNFLKKFDDKKDLKSQLDNNEVRKMLEDDLLKKVFEISLRLEGLKRHTSIHAAGVIISSKKLSNYVPLIQNKDGSYICGYTMNYIEQLGLLKMDFLALKNLSIIDKVIKNVKEISFSNIPLDDKKTFDIFKNIQLDGIFQFESAGMKRFIEALKPNNINDLIAAVALFRPGPMDNITTYIQRRNGSQKVTYIHDDLKEILEPTYGVIVYQEQIMQIAQKMAGFSYAKADELRRAMSKKKQDLLISYKEEFINGSIEKGYLKDVAQKVYDLILKFANYGFNKAHSVAYAIIGYKIAYLKAHYPLYFECEVLNNCIGVANKTKSAINECRKLNVDIIGPLINASTDKYQIIKNKLILPLSIVKLVGTLSAKQIINERNINNEFSSYLDFVKRNYKLGKDVLRNLILSGALQCFGENKRTLIENLDDAINYAELCLDLDESVVLKPEIKKYEEYSKEELAKYEIEIFGFYVSNHPTCKFITDKSITTNLLEKYFDKNIKIVLYLERKKEIETKDKEKMMFVYASDSFGSTEIVIFPKTYKKYFNIYIPDVYEVTGKVEKRFSKLQINLYDIKKI